MSEACVCAPGHKAHQSSKAKEALNCGELRHGEVRRNLLLGTTVNKPGCGRIAAVTGLHDEEHRHDHGNGEHGHTHGAVDPTVATSERGIWAVKWSFLGLLATALVQIVVVLLSGSVALLSDT